MKILVVDDEELLVKGIRFNLQNDGYQVVTGSNGREAIELARDPDIRLIVLDVMMPEVDGLTACRTIREFSDVPIIMLTARTEDMDKLLGFEHGADDYLTKPFELEELEARVRTLLRREFVQRSPLVRVGELALDTVAREISARGEALSLTPREFAILEQLMLCRGRWLSQEELMEHVWAADANPFSNAVRMHISSLRKKLRERLDYDPIQTKVGQGYRLTGEERV